MFRSMEGGSRIGLVRPTWLEIVKGPILPTQLICPGTTDTVVVEQVMFAVQLALPLKTTVPVQSTVTTFPVASETLRTGEVRAKPLVAAKVRIAKAMV
jgi:hypothetical protein